MSPLLDVPLPAWLLVVPGLLFALAWALGLAGDERDARAYTEGDDGE